MPASESDAERESKTITCPVCQVSSDFQEGFDIEKRLLHPSRTLCATCLAYRQKYLHYYIFWLRWIAIATGIGYVVVGSVVAAVVFAVGAYVLTYLAIVLHELGHFITARLLGVDVPVISFGGGLRAKVLRIGRAFLILSPTPTEGLIIQVFKRGDHYRKKSLLIVAAGPLTNIAMALLGLSILLAFDNQYLPNVVGGGLVLWVLINVMMGFGNLSPFKAKTVFGEVMSDGSQILALRRMPDEHIETILRQQGLVRAAIEFSYGDKDECLRILDQELSEEEGSIQYRTLTTAALADTDRIDRGIAIGRQYLTDESLSDWEKAILQNNLAYTLFLRGQPGDLDEANSLSAEAYKLLPMYLFVKSTRGAVLVGLQRYREGIELLTDKKFRMDSPGNQATVHAIRSRALANVGDLDAARKSLRSAYSLERENRHIPPAEAVIQSIEATAAT